MLNFLYTFFNSIFGFVVLMGVLVTIHEYGHFIVARKLGFKVLAFSIGFGKALWQHKGKDGVDYKIGLIPLGGYVAMLDERVYEVAPEEMDQTFNAKPIWKRSLVIAAGPFANIVLTIFLLWGLYIYGIPSVKPYLAEPPENSVLAKVGVKKRDLVLTINDKDILTIDDLGRSLIDHLNGTGKVDLTVLRDNKVIPLTIDLGAPIKLDAKSNLFYDLGLSLYQPDIISYIPAKIGEIVSQSLAQQSGMMVNDEIISIANYPIENWKSIDRVLDSIRHQEDMTKFEIKIKRDQKPYSVMIDPTRAENPKKFILGIKAEPIRLEQLPDKIQEEYQSLQIKSKYGVVDALGRAFTQTKDDALLIFKFISRMIQGNIHINSMAGPISIADIAGKQLEAGWVYFVQLLALFSINLAVINLLPIPILDGGRLVGLGIEKVVGKERIPKRLSGFALQIGAAILFGFMGLVLIYDVVRLF